MNERVHVTERSAGVESSVGLRLEPHDSLHECSGRLPAERAPLSRACRRDGCEDEKETRTGKSEKEDVKRERRL